MFLSKIELNLKNFAVRNGLRNAQDMHRNVQKYFDKERKDLNILYQFCDTGNIPAVYVQSDVPPKETEDTIRNGMRIVYCRDMAESMKKLRNGQYCRFNLVATPTKTDPDPERKYKNPPRHRLYKDEDLAAWINRKAEAGGFEIVQMDTRDVGSRKIVRNKTEFYIGQTQFSGLLKVTDASKFVQTAKEGIGRERAYGSGLMLTCPF